MASSATISLFTERTDLSRQPTSFLASIVIHCGVSALLWFGIAYTPQIDTRVVTEHYTVRHLDLRTPEQESQRSQKELARYPGPRLAGKPAAGKKDAYPSVLHQVAQAQPGPQTLIQPDMPDPVKLKEEVPVPTVVLWTPGKTPVRNIVAPQPKKPTASDVTPSLERPNEETNLADVDLAATNVTAHEIPMLPGTTSPVVVHGPEKVQMAPQTLSQPTAQSTPVTVMSLSDLKMKEGAVNLPPVNETEPAHAPREPDQGEPAPGESHDSSMSGKGATPDSGPGTSPGTSRGSGTAQASGDAAATAPNAPDPKTGPDAGNGQGNQTSATAITMPKDGRFGAVVVGNSLEDQFPEMAGVWSGRLAYTVYLHLGLARSWILQYSLPRADKAAAAGNIAHLDAPWPYNIVRPNLDPGAIEADALMVHGYVNLSGRFETLTIVFPQAFSQAQFVLSSLEQWQFRPAMQNGQGARVEVLLIIPEELN